MSTLVIVEREPAQWIGNVKRVRARAIPFLYATGGETLNPRTFGLTRIDFVHVEMYGVGNSHYLGRWIPGGGTVPHKIAYYGVGAVGAPLAEVAVGTQNSSYGQVWLTVYGA